MPAHAEKNYAKMTIVYFLKKKRVEFINIARILREQK